MSIVRHTWYNLAGACVPILVSLVAVPLYLERIGASRYGVLAIVWLLLSYFGMFDLGLSRATANQIARLREAAVGEREEVFWTACLANAALGAVGGLMLYLIGGPLLGQWFKMSAALHAEAVAALPWVAAAVPVATVTAVLTGVLEGRERFGAVNVVQSSGTMLLQAAPLAAAYLISPRLQVIVPVAVAVRAVSAVPLVILVRAALPMRNRPRFRAARMRSLLSYGAWISVTNFVGPILTSLDRLLIGVLVGVQAVAHYVVPSNLTNQAQIVPSALSRTLFPRLSAEGPRQARLTALESVIALTAVMTPLIVLGEFLIRPFLVAWVGEDFAHHAAPLGEALLLGVWINALAFVPFALLQAQGRPDVVAKFHLLELAPFAVLLWQGVVRFGLAGAAFARVSLSAADALLLFWAAALGSDIAKRLGLSAVLVVSAWYCVHARPRSFDPLRLSMGALLVVFAGIWSLASSARVRREIMKVLAHIGV